MEDVSICRLDYDIQPVCDVEAPLAVLGGGLFPGSILASYLVNLKTATRELESTAWAEMGLIVGIILLLSY